MNEPRLVAIKAPTRKEAQYLVDRVMEEGFEADVFNHGGEHYCRITQLHGTEFEDAIFELSWHFGSSVGSIPDTRQAVDQ